MVGTVQQQHQSRILDALRNKPQGMSIDELNVVMPKNCRVLEYLPLMERLGLVFDINHGREHLRGFNATRYCLSAFVPYIRGFGINDRVRMTQAGVERDTFGNHVNLNRTGVVRGFSIGGKYLRVRRDKETATGSYLFESWEIIR